MASKDAMPAMNYLEYGFHDEEDGTSEEKEGADSGEEAGAGSGEEAPLTPRQSPLPGDQHDADNLQSTSSVEQSTANASSETQQERQPFKRSEVLFLLLALCSLTLVAGLAVGMLLHEYMDSFLALLSLLFTLGFSYYFVIFGIYMERPYEMLVYMLNIFISTCSVTIIFAYSKADAIGVISLIVSWLLFLPNIVFAFPLARRYTRSKDAIKRKVGTRGDLQYMCRVIFIFKTLIILDVQLVLSMVMFIVHDEEIYGTVSSLVVFYVGIPLTVLWLIFGILSYRQEKLWIVIVFFLLSLPTLVYIVYLDIHTILEIMAYADIDMPLTPLPAMVLFLSIFAIATRIGLLCALFFVKSNFGFGIKEKLFPKKSAIEVSLLKKAAGYEELKKPLSSGAPSTSGGYETFHDTPGGSANSAQYTGVPEERANSP